MIYREACGEKLSMLGMGNMRLPTQGQNGPIDEEKAQAIIDYVYESGVNYFDTAYMYHGGQSEVFVGQGPEKIPPGQLLSGHQDALGSPGAGQGPPGSL